MLYTIKTKNSFETVDEKLRAALSARKFGVLGVHDLKKTMNGKGVDFEREVLVYEVCNPFQAKKVLEAKIEISTALPCRISLWQEGSETVLSTILPSQLIGMFEVPELKDVACEVEKDLKAAMDEAAA